MNKTMISISLNAISSNACTVGGVCEAEGEVEEYPLKNVFSGRKRFMGEKRFLAVRQAHMINQRHSVRHKWFFGGLLIAGFAYVSDGLSLTIAFLGAWVVCLRYYFIFLHPIIFKPTLYGGRTMPYSVIIAVISLLSATSKAGLYT